MFLFPRLCGASWSLSPGMITLLAGIQNKLKALITESMMSLESKFKDSQQIPNLLNLVLTTNE